MWNREKDLEDWDRIEKLFMNMLYERNPWCSVEQTQWFFKDYDLKLTKTNGDIITFEVKYDRMCDTTGNVAIERTYDGRKSWIYRSTADYIIYYLCGEFRSIKRRTLIWKLAWYRIINWGDELKSELMLVKLKDFTSPCIKLWQ